MGKVGKLAVDLSYPFLLKTRRQMSYRETQCWRAWVDLFIEMLTICHQRKNFRKESNSAGRDGDHAG